jgi:hypothetical protein
VNEELRKMLREALDKDCPIDSPVLKAVLREAISEPDGVPTALYCFRDLANEIAADQRNICQNEAHAVRWEKLAMTLDRAANGTTGLLEIM